MSGTTAVDESQIGAVAVPQGDQKDALGALRGAAEGGPVEEPKPKRARDATGKFKSADERRASELQTKQADSDKWLRERLGLTEKKDTDAETDRGGDEKAEAETDGEAEKKPRERDPKVKTALQACYRAQLTDEDMADWSDERILKKGQALLKVQSESDRAFRELQDLKRAKESALSESKDSAAAERPAAAQPFDLGKAAEPFAKLLAVDRAEAEPALRDLADAITAPLRAELDSLRQANEGLRMVQVETAVERARDGLRERFPQLGDDAQYDAVLEEMRGMGPLHEGETWKARMQKAAKVVFFDSVADGAAAKKAQETSRQRDASVARTDTGNRTPPKSLSPQDKLRAKFFAIVPKSKGGEGLSPEEARRKYGD